MKLGKYLQHKYFFKHQMKFGVLYMCVCVLLHIKISYKLSQKMKIPTEKWIKVSTSWVFKYQVREDILYLEEYVSLKAETFL